jgi:cytoskeleton protein RodZ
MAVIEALESDRFNDLGAPVFARGHLKRYAELLGAPVDSLLERWSAVQRQSLASADLISMPWMRARSVDTRVWGRRVGTAAVALVIGLAAWWILKGSGTATTPPEQMAAQALSPPPPTPAPLPVAPDVVAPIAASASAVAGEPVRLRLAAREDSWIQVVDATGRRLYFGTLRRDKSVSFNAVAPLRVLVGRADATSVELAGRPVPVPSSIIVNATAHFTIDPTGKVQRVLAPVQP